MQAVADAASKAVDAMRLIETSSEQINDIIQISIGFNDWSSWFW